jgi:hypothetical protein
MCGTGFAPGTTTSLSTAVVKKIRSPQTIGDEWPRPGIGVFQRTFFSVHSVGTSAAVEMPWPAGPRQPGQLASGSTAGPARIVDTPAAREKRRAGTTRAIRGLLELTAKTPRLYGLAHSREARRKNSDQRIGERRSTV